MEKSIMPKFHIYYQILGSHVHLQIYAGNENTKALAGTLCLTVLEFKTLEEWLLHFGVRFTEGKA
jgi:hypothetical protein